MVANLKCLAWLVDFKVFLNYVGQQLDLVLVRLYWLDTAADQILTVFSSTTGWTTSGQLVASFWLKLPQLSTFGQLLVNFWSTFGECSTGQVFQRLHQSLTPRAAPNLPRPWTIPPLTSLPPQRVSGLTPTIDNLQHRPICIDEFHKNLKGRRRRRLGLRIPRRVNRNPLKELHNRCCSLLRRGGG